MRTIAAGKILVLVCVAVMIGCTRAPEAASGGAAATAQEKLLLIPDPDASKYSNQRDLREWQNPRLIVRTDGIGLVDLSNHEIHILQPDQVPAQLASLPPSAWPYGRVVLVTQVETKNPTDQMKADLRKNRGLLVGTLMALKVQIQLP